MGLVLKVRMVMRVVADSSEHGGRTNGTPDLRRSNGHLRMLIQEPVTPVSGLVYQN